MNVVDSSGWLEYFSDSRNAAFFAKPVEDKKSLLVPTVSIYEVFKRIHQQRDETSALQAIALMQQGRVVDLTPPLSLLAAKTSLETKLSMADSIILATARYFNALLWTQDRDFENLKGVKYKEN